MARELRPLIFQTEPLNPKPYTVACVSFSISQYNPNITPIQSKYYPNIPEGVQILCAAKSDPGHLLIPGMGAFDLACASGSWRVLSELQARGQLGCFRRLS